MNIWKIWSCSYDVIPPAEDKRNPKNLPANESLEKTVSRVAQILIILLKKIRKKLIIAAHCNLLRALIKYFDKMFNDAIYYRC